MKNPPSDEIIATARLLDIRIASTVDILRLHHAVQVYREHSVYPISWCHIKPGEWLPDDEAWRELFTQMWQ